MRKINIRSLEVVSDPPEQELDKDKKVKRKTSITGKRNAAPLPIMSVRRRRVSMDTLIGGGGVAHLETAKQQPLEEPEINKHTPSVNNSAIVNGSSNIPIELLTSVIVELPEDTSQNTSEELPPTDTGSNSSNDDNESCDDIQSPDEVDLLFKETVI